MQAYFQIQCHKQYQEGVHEKALMIAWRLVFGRVVEASRGISFLFCIVIPPRDKPSQIGSDVHGREKREFKLAEMQRHTRTEVNVPRSSRSPTIVTRSLALSFSSESIKQHKSISRYWGRRRWWRCGIRGGGVWRCFYRSWYVLLLSCRYLLTTVLRCWRTGLFAISLPYI